MDVTLDSAQVYYLDCDAECDRPRGSVALPGVLAGDKPGATTTHMAPTTFIVYRRTVATHSKHCLFSSFKFHFVVMVRHTGVATETFHSASAPGGGGGKSRPFEPILLAAFPWQPAKRPDLHFIKLCKMFSYD